mmetsp:Transcript_31180/g.70515  ORF Transcript_31180/g.70515 Transcript_31180/m.70515 type:complete len:884 (-) Transcript_31180:72-2723(-)
MADLVGRTISASPGNASGRAGSMPPRVARSGQPTARSRTGLAASSNVGHRVSSLYDMVEEAMMNMPAPNSGSEPRLAELNRLREMMNTTWDSIREWLAAHPSESERSLAATHQGQFLTTALHMVCKLMDPPVDIIESLIECAPETATWPDSNGWLPLTHACANGASCKVLQVLVDAYPEGKTVQDKRHRTPLHFAFFRKDAKEDSTLDGAITNKGINNQDGEVGNSMTEIVRLLSDSGAAELQDEGGMLPMHYAAAYGTTREVLEILVERYPGSVSQRENKGRNPLHLAMVNAHRHSSPKVVGFLLEGDSTDIIDAHDDDRHLPIHLLAMASKFPEEKVMERKNASDCLKLYLNAKPKASADFLTAIQTLPEWLRDIAVISDHIQDILNHKIVQRLPTMILILDFAFLMFGIVLFELTTGQAIDKFFDPNCYDSEQIEGFDNGDKDGGVCNHDGPNKSAIIVILIGGTYFLLRELIQVISLVALGNVSSWVWDMENWLDVMLIFLMFYFSAVMLSMTPLLSPDAFRNGTAITKGIMWMGVISYLKSVQVEFSVFVSGVTYVVQSLAAFLMALGVILLMFAQMFYIVYAETDECACGEEFPDANPYPHCNIQLSLLKVYTMMMGEIGNEMRYSTVPVAEFFYVAFVFLVVILLGNVLIAIVTDSYAVVKNERSAMVFWSNRLDFVAEIDAIKNIGRFFKKCCGKGDGAEGAPMRVQETPNGDPIPLDSENDYMPKYRAAWASIMDLFDANLYETYDVRPLSFEFWCYVLVRIAAILFVIPVWLAVGLCTAGWFWPPQVREFLFQQKKATISRADMAEQVTAQINDLKSEIKKLRVEMKTEMSSDRKEFAFVKAEVEAVQAEVMADLLQVKEIMVTLLDMTRDNM